MTDTTRAAALACAEVAYNARVSGLSPELEQPSYTGTFDFMMVAKAASLPMNGSVSAHRKAWAAMRELFSYEWDKFEQDRMD